MQKLERYCPYLFALLLIVLFYTQLQSVQEYVFYHREQQQVMAWDFDILCQRYHGVAGFSLFFAHFLSQFFFILETGACITVLLAMIAVMTLWYGCNRFCHSFYLFPLCAIPVAFELSNLNDAYYLYQGFISYVLLCVFIAVYAWLADKFSLYARMVIGTLLSVLLFYLSGPVCLLLGTFILIHALLAHKEKWYYHILPLLVVALITVYAVRWCWLPSTRTAFSQDLYYNMLLSVPKTFKLSWVLLLILPFLFFATSKLQISKLGMRLALSVVLFLCVGTGVYALSEKDRKNTDILLELQHDAITENWDAILNNRNAYSQNYLVMNYVNLALSKKHLLLSHFFRYPQRDVQNIMVAREIDDTNVPLSFVFSFITYQMGDMGAAQNHAHDTFVCTMYGQPTMLKMLVKTNLIKGAYPVAEKYITLLEKTWRYSDWAKNMRKFLYNDKAVEADPDLGLMRRDLPDDDTMTSDTFECLIKTLETNPEDMNARDYLIAYLFLYRDQDYINRVVEKFHDTPALKPFPEQLQEAFLLVNNGNIDYCRSYGVSEGIIKRYAQFMNFLDEVKRRGLNPAQTMRKSFGNTIWYQFMFN
ncbi:MAG: DUF6057 family protein [Phocaeicola sp.]|uniref:DUF6057 family protein n=1 Tax=Phocaeicola sp. TaxID=2773926 RepID=UPI003FA0A7C5